MSTILQGTLDQLLNDLATELKTSAERGVNPRVIGFAGAPGAGKSQAVAKLQELLQDAKLGANPLVAGIIPMDGFHKSNEVLELEELSDRKGAPDTFDVVGYLMTLDRAHDGSTIVYAPGYDRELGQAIAARHRVERRGIVITEGNYLALQEGPWLMVREAIDLLIYLDVPEDVTRQRLLDRHTFHGRTPAQAEAWINTVDNPNRLLIEGSRGRADRIWTLHD